MKKLLPTLMCITQSVFSFCQYIEVDHFNQQSLYASDRASQLPSNPELFRNGFIDFLSNGNIQASARVLRINIGEPGGFHIPFLIYSGVTGQAFGQNKDNKTTISNLLNPVGGIANFSFSKTHDIIPSSSSYTKLKVAYQLGSRLVNGTDTITKNNINFFNGFGNIGIYFQTGAWEETSTTVGIFWVQAKAMASLSSKEKLESFFGDVGRNYLYGYYLDAGLEIDKLINIKFSVYQYINNSSSVSLMDKPVVKLSLDYNFNK